VAGLRDSVFAEPARAAIHPEAFAVSGDELIGLGSPRPIEGQGQERRSRMRHTRFGLIAVVAVALLAGGACDDDAQDKAKEKAEGLKKEAGEKAGEAGARATAEAYRVSLKAQETDDAAGGVRQVTVLQAAAEDLPGDPDITGIEDGDGDGLDDDGYVQVNAGDESACVTLPESGDDIDVSGGACPAS
jgi:hypothetical protein